MYEVRENKNSARGVDADSLFQRLSRTTPTRRFRAPEYVARRALELNMMFVAVDLIRRRSQSMFSTFCHVFEISDDQWCMTTSLNSLRTGQPRSLPDPVFPLFRSHAFQPTVLSSRTQSWSSSYGVNLFLTPFDAQSTCSDAECRSGPREEGMHRTERDEHAFTSLNHDVFSYKQKQETNVSSH